MYTYSFVCGCSGDYWKTIYVNVVRFTQKEFEETIAEVATTVTEKMVKEILSMRPKWDYTNLHIEDVFRDERFDEEMRKRGFLRQKYQASVDYQGLQRIFKKIHWLDDKKTMELVEYIRANVDINKE